MSTGLILNLSCRQTDLYPEARRARCQTLPDLIYYPPFHKVEGVRVAMLHKILHTEGAYCYR